MADAYATIASGGYRNRPTAITKITFPDGRVESRDLPRRFRVKRTKAFEDGVTAEATQILEQNIQGGTGTHADDRLPGGRQDRHHRQATPTPGSSASRRGWPPPSGSATPTRRSR